MRDTQQKNDCANIGVYGRVREKGSDRPVPFVTIEIKGEGDYKGPYIGKTDKDGKYSVFIAPLKDKVEGVKFEAKVVGAGVSIDDEDNEWRTSSDCHDNDGIQVYEMNWNKK